MGPGQLLGDLVPAVSRGTCRNWRVFHDAAKGKAVVLGVNMESIDTERLRVFVEQQFLSYPILLAGEQPRRAQ